MRIDVHIIGNRALLSYVPHLAARILWGRQTTERYAVRGAANLWTFDDDGRFVDAETLTAINAARAAAFRTSHTFIGRS